MWREAEKTDAMLYEYMCKMVEKSDDSHVELEFVKQGKDKASDWILQNK